MRDNDVLISQWRSEIETRLLGVERWVVGRPGGTKLHQASRYVSEGGGKRLRGLLACSVANDLLVSGVRRGERALSSAVALELLHAASLVHDDLPALDNDDIRRGRAACHKAFGEATAILTGDALVGAALIHVTQDAELSSDNQARITRTLAQAWWDLCLGQQFDIEQQCGASDSIDRTEMVRLKTGALFGAAVGCGAVCAGVREAVLDRYIAWGTRVGECFQALDDLEDGDRPAEDHAEIQSECRDLQQSAGALDARLLGGVTSAVVATIVGSNPD
ncbi:MAG: polyprenyl synthetase family protein [Pseudomonadota bacterium]